MRFRVQQRFSFALLGLLAMLTGCTDGAGDAAAERKSKLVLGFSQVVAEANWNKAKDKSIQDAERDAGVELRLEDAQRSQEKQLAELRAFVSQRVDVIAFSPVVETGWEFVLREIRSAGIPVIL